MYKIFILFILSMSLFDSNPTFAQNYSDSLTQALTRHYQNSNLPGFAVAIINESGVLYQHGFGYADISQKRPFTPNTVLNLGSVSKTFAGVALVKAIEAGKITMDTKINDVLPFEIVHPRFKESPILVRHLVAHTSSLTDTRYYGQSYIWSGREVEAENVSQDFLNFIKSHEQISLETFLKRIYVKGEKWYKKKNFLKTKPGTTQEYANLNAALMAYILEQLIGQPYDAYTREQILEPLNMNASAWSYRKIDMTNLAKRYFPRGQIVPAYSLITYPDGGLYSTVADLSHYLREMILAYGGDSDFLRLEYAQLLLPGDDDNERAFWGMGQKSRNIGHGGSDPGTQTDMQFNADSRIGRIIFTNVNAEDNQALWEQYRGIHDIIAKYEGKIK